MSEVVYVDEDKLKLKSGIVFDFAELGTFLNAYLELQDRIIVHVYHDTEKRTPTFNLCRNIFCYSKEDGHLVWQIEQPYGRDHQPLEAVYKYIALYVKGDNGEWLSIEENGSLEVDHELDDGSEIGGQIYLKPFRKGIDRLATMTLDTFPNEYWVDYETGKVEWFAIHQKV